MGSKPKFEPDLKQVEELAAQGLSQKEICLCLDISEPTLYKYKKKSTDFAQALKRGQAKGMEMIVNNLVQQSHDGNTAATIFYLKNRGRDNWRDKWAEDEEQTNKVVVDISMVGVPTKDGD